jgi:ankyrin repeat protein
VSVVAIPTQSLEQTPLLTTVLLIEIETDICIHYLAMKDPKWIELQRLLYCMEEQPDPIDGQSWQSLLLRAQLAQDLWHGVASRCSQEEYDRLAHRVDQACRHAQELANRYQQQEHANASSSSADDDGDDDIVDNNSSNHQDIDTVIENLFFGQEANGEEEGLEETSEEEEDYDDYEDEEDAEESPTSEHHTSSTSDQTPQGSSLEELQQAQREQMEEAIAMMARQMKESTQGIHATLQQQTKSTLDELETVAEQNVQDVTQVSQNIQQHNSNRRASNFGTWTMLFMIVGVFVGCLLTIFTIPKTPNSSALVFISKGTSMGMSLASKGVSIGMPLVSLAWTRSIKLYGNIMHPEDIWDDDDEQDKEGAANDEDALSNEEWKSLYDENEMERQQKEQLDKLLQGMKNKEKKKKLDDAIPDWRDLIEEEEEGEEGDEAESPDDEEDNPWGQKPVEKKMKEEIEEDEEDNPWGQKPVKMDKPAKEAVQGADDNPFGRKPVAVDEKEDKKEDTNDNPWGGAPVKTETNVNKDDDGAGEGNEVPLADVTEHDIENRWDSPSDAKVEDYDKYKGNDKEPREKVLDTVKKEDQEVKDPSEVDMDQLLASLKQYAQQKDDILAEQHEHAQQAGADEHLNLQNRLDQPPKKPLPKGEAGAFEREGVAKMRFSPRDLRLAAGNGDIEKVKEYLDLHPEFVNRQDKNGWSPLHLAARNIQIDLLQVLLDYGGDKALATNVGELAYQIAAQHHGRAHYLVELLRPEGMIDVDDLRFAASTRNLDRVKQCLQLHPEFVNIQDRLGWSPLHEAARNADMATIEVLLQADADKTLVTSSNETPFRLAVQAHGRDHEAATLVRPEGLVEVDDLRLAVWKGDYDRVKEYLDVRPDFVNQQEHAGWSALHEAARHGAIHIVKLLLDHGGDKDLKTQEGETAGQLAVNFHGIDNEVAMLLLPPDLADDEAAQLRQQGEEEHRKRAELQRMNDQARRDRDVEARRLERKTKREKTARLNAKEKQRKEQQTPDGALKGNQQEQLTPLEEEEERGRQAEEARQEERRRQKEEEEERGRQAEEARHEERRIQKEELVAARMKRSEERKKAKEEEEHRAKEEEENRKTAEKERQNEEAIHRRAARDKARAAAREEADRNIQ